jgi:uncharacterized membrane protein
MSHMTDARMEVAIGKMLRAGVTLAAAVVLVGGIVYLTQNFGPRPDYKDFHAVPEALRRPVEIAGGALHGDGRSIIQLGLLFLIATPVARVVLAAVSFLLERDRLYFVVSTVVLAVLVYSLLHTR